VPGMRGAEGEEQGKGVTARWGLQAAWNVCAERRTRTRSVGWHRRDERARDGEAPQPQTDWT
jgi:hypothetical protein